MRCDSIGSGEKTPEVKALASFEGCEDEGIKLDDVVQGYAHANGDGNRQFNLTACRITGPEIF
jgi:hypothetical protein